MRVFTCAIVEDSNVHRILLEKSIYKNSQLALQFSFESPGEAFRMLESTPVDIIFLDIEMPMMNGFELLEKLRPKSQIIITSQNPTHALEAYGFNVSDYLLKPIQKNRFDSALKKTIKKIKSSAIELPENKLIVKHDLKQVELNMNAILYVQALGDYVKVVTVQRNYIVLSTLSSFQKKLKQYQFLRIHKSYIVNLRMVDRYNHEYIEIKDKKLPISRTKNLELDQLLNYLD